MSHAHGGEATTFALTTSSSQAQLLEVHAVIQPGPASFTVTGTTASCAPETRDRVRAAIANTGYTLPPAQITVRLTTGPSQSISKEADLAIAIAVLTAAHEIPSHPGAHNIYAAGLGLNGGVRPIPATIHAAHLATSEPAHLLVAPEQQVDLTDNRDAIRVGRIENLVEVIHFLNVVGTGQRPGTEARDQERAARVTWSYLAEPDDADAHALVADLGPQLALDVVRIGRTTRRWEDKLGEIRDDAEDILDKAAVAGSRLLSPGDDEWPLALGALGKQAPFCLWVRGPANLTAATTRAVALIGSRAATTYGEHVASDLASGCAAQAITVISGAAYGIDAAAHKGALIRGGLTIAVVPSGLDQPYPQGNAALIEQIAQTGAVISELPAGSRPNRHRFLARNRLIAALANAMTIVEASERSGTLSMAKWANRLGKPLAAVPGPVTSPTSAGCHRLLRAGATCVTSPAEVASLLHQQAAY